MFHWYASLVAERRRDPDLADDRLDALVVAADDDAWLVLSHGRVRVVVNLAAEAATVPVQDLGGSAEVVLAWDPAGTSHTEGSVTLPGHSVVLLRLAS
jgi:maltooligosyltrehalose trehalohydrolase